MILGASDFISLMRNEILKVNRDENRGFELATVLSPYPNLAVKIDNMKLLLTRQDIMVCERLTRNTRVVSLKSTPQSIRQLGDGTGTDSNSISRDSGHLVSITGQTEGHQHTLEDFDLENAAISLNYIEIDFEEVLKKGDRVLLQALSGGQKYVIIDKVVE
jgi:hypothetical protein